MASLLRLVRDQRTKTKIVLAVAVVAVIGTAVGVFAVAQMSRINDEVGSVYNENLETQAVALVRNAVNRAWLDARDHFLAPDAATMKTKAEAIAKDESDVAGALANLAKFPLSEAQRRAMADFDTNWTAYLGVLHNELLPLSEK